MCEKCSKLTIKTPERAGECAWSREEQYRPLVLFEKNLLF